MAQRLLEARYVYHWNPLAGSLVGQLHGLGVEVESAVVATVTGLAVQPPPSLPPSTEPGEMAQSLRSPPVLRGKMPQLLRSPPVLRGEMSRSDRGGSGRRRRTHRPVADVVGPPSAFGISPHRGERGKAGISPRRARREKDGLAVGEQLRSLRPVPPHSAEREEDEPAAFTPRPHVITIPPFLREGLQALGLQVSIVHRRASQQSRIEPVQRRLIRRRIRRELAHQRPVTAFRAGLDLAGPTWGLIIGFDDTRRSWYRDGPLTEQVGPWLAETDVDRAPDLCAILIRIRRPPDRDALLAAAMRAQTDAVAWVVEALEEWIAVLESDARIDPQGHAQAAQTLAAGWGEAAEFWRAQAESSAVGDAAQAAALTLSRFATLFPYPMGGAPNTPGLRRAAATILRETIDALG